MAAKAFEPASFENRTTGVRGILGTAANERRLTVLCKWGEANATALAEAFGLGPSVLSQHLAKLR